MSSEKKKKKKNKIRFNVKTKPKGSARKHHLLSESPLTPTEGSTNGFFDSTIAFADASDDPGLRLKFLAICGSARPIDELLACNQPAVDDIRNRVGAAVLTHLKASPSRVGLQTTRIAVSPGSAVEVSMSDVRLAGRMYERAKVDVVATARLCPVPYSADPLEVGMAIELVALVFTPNADFKIATASGRARLPTGVTRSSIEWFEADDKEALDIALKKMFTPPFTGLPPGNTFDSPPAPPDWASDANCGLRAFLTLMCRSQLPVRKMLLGIGAGKPLITGVIAAAEHALKQACKDAAPIIHRDAVPHFWFSELRRLGLDDVSVPVVMLR